MKSQDRWNSNFRKTKFYNKQKEKRIKNYDYEKIGDNIIAVLLDLQGTCDFIDGEKAKIFIKQINKIRNVFQADTAYISISTHYSNSQEIKKVLDIFSSLLPSRIKIGTSFFNGGTYDYEENLEKCKYTFFNSNKLDTFRECYFHKPNHQLKWFAFIDDQALDTLYRQFQDNKPMLLSIPSASFESVSRNNFMRIATTTRGFDGVIETLNIYIHSIQKLTPTDILLKQKNMIRHLSSFELSDKVKKQDFTYLVQYFTLGFADSDDYIDVLEEISFLIHNENFSKENYELIQKILSILRQNFSEKQDQKTLEKVKRIKDELNN